MSTFANVQPASTDPILGLTEAFNADGRQTKVNLGIGIYYDESGAIPKLRAVAQAEEALMRAGRPYGYLPIDGLSSRMCLRIDLVSTKGIALRYSPHGD